MGGSEGTLIDGSGAGQYPTIRGYMASDQTNLDRPRFQGSEGKSPFRYPGGKAYLLPEIQAAIRASGSDVKYYAEPYAGGAGAAIELLANGIVDKVLLNDADPRIFCAWQAMLTETDGFLALLRSAKLNLPTWHRYNAIVKCPDLATDELELGFAAFFMNRTNRSGIILGAGPIGGYAQEGKWKMGARYYPETMRKRIEWLAERRAQIRISNVDGVEFIRSFRAKKARRTFFFIDPPYVGAGGRLYLDTMTVAKHRELALAVRLKKSVRNWLMTYDDHPLVRDLYSDFSVAASPIRYSLQNKRTEFEIKISPAKQTMLLSG